MQGFFTRSRQHLVRSPPVEAHVFTYPFNDEDSGAPGIVDGCRSARPRQKQCRAQSGNAAADDRRVNDPGLDPPIVLVLYHPAIVEPRAERL